MAIIRDTRDNSVAAMPASLLLQIREQLDIVTSTVGDLKVCRQSMGIGDNGCPEPSDKDKCCEKSVETFCETWKNLPNHLNDISQNLYEETNLLDEHLILSDKKERLTQMKDSVPDDQIGKVQEAIDRLDLAVDYFSKFVSGLMDNGMDSCRNEAPNVKRATPCFREVWQSLPGILIEMNGKINVLMDLLKSCIYDDNDKYSKEITCGIGVAKSPIMERSGACCPR